MYIFILSLVALIAAGCPLQGMEAPVLKEFGQCEITVKQPPLYSQTAFDQELHKFKRYDLDNPARFIELLGREFKKDNPLLYLQNLQYFASFLLQQHSLMQQLINFDYMVGYIRILKDRRNKILSSLRPVEREKVQEGELIYIDPRTVEGVNLMLSYSRLFLTPRRTLEHMETIILPWIVSDNPEIKAIAMSFKADYEFMAAVDMINELLDAIRKKLRSLSESSLNVVNMTRMGRENKRYWDEFFDNHNRFMDKQEKAARVTKRIASQAYIAKEFEDSNHSLVSLYQATNPWYSQLYALVRKEINDTIKEQLDQHPRDIEFTKSIKPYTLVVPSQAYEAGLVSSKTLPMGLPAFVFPSEFIRFVCLDDIVKKIEATALSEQKVQEQEKGQAGLEPKEELAPQEAAAETVMARGDDGSYILEGEETDENITIHNPAHNTLEILFKTDQPSSIGDIPFPSYTPWVKQWFDNPGQALVEQGYTIPGSIKYTPPDQYGNPIAVHAFSRLADSFINVWGTKTMVPNKGNPRQKDILITIPGMMVMPDGQKVLGVYAYLIDSKNGQWYHRMFTPHTSKRLIQDLFERGYFTPEMKGYYEVMFPPLGKGTSKE